MYVQTPTHKFEESNTARHEHAGMAEQSENVEYAGAAVASPLRQRNTEDLPDVTVSCRWRNHCCPTLAMFALESLVLVKRMLRYGSYMAQRKRPGRKTC